MVNLAARGKEIARDLMRIQSEMVPLPLAASLAVHETFDEVNAVVPRREYEVALNPAAAALSRLLRVFQVHDASGAAQPVDVSLTTGRFRRGATAFELSDGRNLVGLAVRRDELPAATLMVANAGLPIQFTVSKIYR